MSVNSAKKALKRRAIQSLMVAMLGVCSVSLEGHAYPHTSVETIKVSRSARDVSKPSRASEYNAAQAPFAPGTHNLSLGVGQVFLLGSLGNRYENAIGPELNYTYGVSDLFAFETNFGYHSHSNGNLSVWNLAAGLRTNLVYFDQLVPFFNIGLGFYHPSLTFSNGGEASSLLFGMQLGAGIDLLISQSVFFGTRITFNDMFNSSKTDSSGVRQSLGGSYFSFMVHAGVTF